MSVLIKGMEMPTSCYKCPLRRRDGMDIVCPVAHERFSVADVNILEYRLDNCTLVPVPPHGRLGDLDALYEKFSRLESEAMNALKTTTTGSVNWIKWSAILTERTGYKHDIADAPPVIPAEEGET